MFHYATAVSRSTLLVNFVIGHAALLHKENLTLVGMSSIRFSTLTVDSLEHVLTVDSPASTSSLAAYCAQTDHGKEHEGRTEFVVGQPVMANWMKFGVYYKAHITGVNADGTYNLRYDDDRLIERNVKPSEMKPRKTGPKNFDPSKDPACALKGEVEDLNAETDRAVTEIGRYMSQRRQEAAAAKEQDQASSTATSRVGDAGPASSTATSRIGDAGPAQAAKVRTGTASEGVDGKDDGLREVIDSCQKVDDKLKKIQDKGEELAKSDKLDPELAVAIEDASNRQAEVKENVKVVERAMAQEEKALQKLKEAKKDAPTGSTGSEKQGSDTQKLRRRHEAEVQAQDEEKEAAAKVQEGVERLQTSLREVKQTSRNFDTQVTPNEAKWWRFRYEYSYVEALVMLFILPVVMCLSALYGRIRKAEQELARFDSLLDETATMHISWLNYAAGEMFVGLLVILLIWLLATFGCFDWLVEHVRDDSFHLPTMPVHYRVMAVNVSMQLGLTLIAYHALVYSIVRASVLKIRKWHEFEVGILSARGPPEDPTSSMGFAHRRLSRATTLSGDALQFNQMKEYFIANMDQYPQIKEKLEEVGGLDSSFPFVDYLSVNVRMYTDYILELKAGFWLAAWLTFLVFMMLHRFAFMAYIRIMSFFAFMLVATLLGILYEVYKETSRIDAHQGLSPCELKDQELKTAVVVSQEQMYSYLLQFQLFFLCYGFVRMTTAPWLWHIYFYNVLFLTCIFVAALVTFIFIFAPLVPSYFCALSIPPNIAEADAEVIVKALKHKMDAVSSPVNRR